MSDNHGRDHEQTVELALDEDGLFLALRLTGYGNLGGYLRGIRPQPPTLNVRNIISLYRTPLLEVSTKCVFTNTTLVSPYRGAGRPEGNLLHGAADRLRRGRDRHRPHRAAPPQPIKRARNSVQVRLRHHLRQRRLPGLFKQALDVADWKGFKQRKRESKKRGKLRGIGVGCYLEVTAPANKEWAASASTPTAPSPSAPARSTTARATPRRSRRC